jgi:hypothetical protein
VCFATPSTPAPSVRSDAGDHAPPHNRVPVFFFYFNQYGINYLDYVVYVVSLGFNHHPGSRWIFFSVGGGKIPVLYSLHFILNHDPRLCNRFRADFGLVVKSEKKDFVKLHQK